MNPEVIARLIAVNHRFYQTFAEDFSATRARLQPGVIRILKSLPPTAAILDLGCGNGTLARELAQRGHDAPYVGLDFSGALLKQTRQVLKDLSGLETHQFTFLETDLTTPDWDTELPHTPFDRALAFAVLHHLPSEGLRTQVLEKVWAQLASGGQFIHANWQFLNSQRLRERIQPWEKVGLQEHEVDPGDYLLDWRRGGYGLRYVHHFTNG